VTGGERPLATPHARGSLLAVVVTPRSGRNRVDVDENGGLRVRVTASPVEGAANALVLAVLADAAGVPRSRLEIVSGERGRRKRILVRDVSAEDLDRRLRLSFAAMS
jgi:uncharacterized protein (TIGR00251 family)